MKIINNAKSMVLAIAFLLSWAVPTFGQPQNRLYIYPKIRKQSQWQSQLQ